MASRNVAGYLAKKQENSNEAVAAEWSKFEELYNKKLWHQLTLAVLDFVKNQDGLEEMYHSFIADFEHRINPLSLAELATIIFPQIKVIDEAIAFLESIRNKVKGNEEAIILCRINIGRIQINQKNLTDAKKTVEETEVLLDKLDGVTSVHDRFYLLASDYHKIMGNHAAYYKDALRFLGCTDVSKISDADKQVLSFNLGLAALLGKGVYNFGELLAHEILNSIRGTSQEWLVDLLYAFNSGNLAKFEQLRPKWQTQGDLAASEDFLRQKIQLLCLMEMTFRRPANHRQLTFDEISKESHVPLSDVELLVMKALSLNLVKGTIDQIDSKVHMTWVQPRVLDLEQLGVMQGKLKQWCVDVKNMEMLVETKAQDILT